MDHWPWCTWLPLWSLWCCAPLYSLWRSCSHWCDDQRCWHGHRWGRSPKVLLEPFPKSPCRFLYVLLIPIQSVTFIPWITLLFCVMLSLPLGATRIFLRVLPPWSGPGPTLPQTFLKLLLLFGLLVEWLLFCFGPKWCYVYGSCWFGVCLRPKWDT